MSMSGYTKLFNSILASTIWRAGDKTRLVWITLLAMADREGIAEGSVPGLADFARVSIEDCEAALDELQSPDRHSRTPDNDGRRIEVIPGLGWKLLNHGKYRAKMNEDERREYFRRKQEEHRARQKMSNGVKSVKDNKGQSRKLTHAEAEAEAEADTKKEEEPPNPRKRGKSVMVKSTSRSESSEGFAEFWELYPRKAGKGAAEKSWIKMNCEPLTLKITNKVKLAKQTAQWKKENGQFIPNPATWLNQKRWEDELTPERSAAEPPTDDNERL